MSIKLCACYLKYEKENPEFLLFDDHIEGEIEDQEHDSSEEAEQIKELEDF